MANPRSERSPQSQVKTHQTWATPSVEVIPLDCEITAYAPDGDSPLF